MGGQVRLAWLLDSRISWISSDKSNVKTVYAANVGFLWYTRLTDKTLISIGLERVWYGIREQHTTICRFSFFRWQPILNKIAIFLLYFGLRVIALASHSTKSSDLAFDILACAACITFPRLVFFVIKENVVILAVSLLLLQARIRFSPLTQVWGDQLRGMVASFVSFMTVTSKNLDTPLYL